MRKLFNDNRLWERLQEGEFTSIVLQSRAAPATAGEPAGTLSQMVSYRDSESYEIARVHQYVRPDRSIGAKGRPDPKRLFLDGVLYRLVKNPQAKPLGSDT